jgi:hypothetical protein
MMCYHARGVCLINQISFLADADWKIAGFLIDSAQRFEADVTPNVDKGSRISLIQDLQLDQ